MEAQSQKNNGLNRNPLAPAQSKRIFAFSGKLEIPLKMHPFQLPCSLLCSAIFEAFTEKSKKKSRVWPQSRKNTPNGPQGRPNGAHESANLAPRCNQVRKTCNSSQQRWQSGAPSVAIEPQTLQSARKTQTKIPKVLPKPEHVPQVPKNTQAHIDHKPKQPTKQGNKEHTHLHKQTP